MMNELDHDISDWNINIDTKKSIYLCLNIKDNIQRAMKWQNVNLNLSKPVNLVESFKLLYKWYKLGNINAIITFNVPYISDNNENILLNALKNSKWIELIYKSLNYIINEEKIKNENDYQYPYKHANNKIQNIAKMKLNERILIVAEKYGIKMVKLSVILKCCEHGVFF